MRIAAVHHAQITIPSDAESQARDFYCRLLGLPEIEKPEPLKACGGFWLQVGPMQVHVSLQDGVERHGVRAHLAYLVDDVAAWRAYLTGVGFQPEDNAPIPGYDRFEFRDPFGNRIEIIQQTG